MDKKEKILICGILPPPFFGHSMVYKVLMRSGFTDTFDVTFLDMRFWSYKSHKRITFFKLLKFLQYLFRYIVLIVMRRPRYILYNISFDKMPLLKDFLFCWIGKTLGCRIVLHDMGQYIGELYHSSSGFYRWLIKRLCAMATASIVLGEKTRTVYGGFMEGDKVISVPGSVEDSRQCVPGDVGPKGKTATDGKINVLYLSFLSVSKGLFTALRAIPQVIQENPEVIFTFAGPMESEFLHRQMNDFIVEHHLESYVRYLGYIEDENRRAEIFRGADIFIFPTHRDVFGLVLLHAMAEGLPVIASVEGTIPEIIQDKENGFLFTKGHDRELAEKIILLARDQALREKMRNVNRARYLAQYTPEKYGQRMIEAFYRIKKLDQE